MFLQIAATVVCICGIPVIIVKEVYANEPPHDGKLQDAGIDLTGLEATGAMPTS